VGLSHRNAVVPLQRKIETTSSQLKEHQEIMRYYPYTPENFRFIGSPVDGIQFEADRILFVLFKKENLSLTVEQERIKKILEDGKVSWFEFMTK
jgi:predicted Holliday junction resolvase-like endonuclease